MSRTCPFCQASIHTEALKCPFCHSVVGDYKICPDCRESAPHEAVVCRYCAHRWPGPEEDATPEEEAILAHVWSDSLGAMIVEPSITALFFPPELTVSSSEARIRKWSLMGMRTYRQRITLERVASVRYLKGVFWGGIVIETYGGSSSDLVIGGLRKKEAREVADLLEDLTRQQSKAAG
jgi:hypothetical protein